MATPHLVRDWMSTPLQTLRRNQKLSLADDLLGMKRIRHLPVLDDDEDVLVGILSQRDLFRSALARSIGYGETAQRKLLDMLVAKDVMTNQVFTIAPDATLDEAARMLLEHKVGCLVVVEGERVVGILTESDFVRRYLDDS